MSQDPWKIQVTPARERFKNDPNRHECREEVLEGGTLENTFVERDKQGWYLRTSIRLGNHYPLYYYEMNLSVRPEIKHCPFCGEKLDTKKVKENDEV